MLLILWRKNYLAHLQLYIDMEINILRGQNQIGGSIIEISSKNTKIILDIGSNLDDKEIIVPEIEGLFKREAKYDGVLISHYHGDHIGLATKILLEIFFP